MGIQLLRNLVAIIPDKAEEVSSGGIHLAKPQTRLRGTVVTAGPGTYTERGDFVKTIVKPGDKVAYSKQSSESADVIDIDGKELLVLPEDVIIAIIQK